MATQKARLSDEAQLHIAALSDNETRCRIDKFDMSEVRGLSDKSHIADLLEYSQALKAQGVQGGYRYSWVRRVGSGGTYLWGFQSWGVLSDELFLKYGDKYINRTTRLDARIVISDASELNASDVYDVTAMTSSHKVNVQLFNTRPTPQKKDARGAGGKGVQFGSHKSDKRAVIYHRTGESGIVEGTLATGGLKPVVETFRMMTSSGIGSGNEYRVTAILLVLDKCVAVLRKAGIDMDVHEGGALLYKFSGEDSEETGQATMF